MSVPLVDLAAQWAEIHDEVTPRLQEVLTRGLYVGGPDVAAFEEEYAAFVGAAHCVGVANGTDALELALRAVGVATGDEVVLPANTFIATAEAVTRIGAVPVLVDVDEDHLLIDPVAVERAISARTAAIVPVHLFGQCAPVERIEPIAAAAGIAVVEDAAQSQGATRLGRAAGSMGLAAATSFYPGKNLGAAGDAGAVTSDDLAVADRVRVLAAHGSRTKYVHEVAGMNSRLDAVQAVVLRAKLGRLKEWNECRRAAAARYTYLLDGVEGVRAPVVAGGNDDVWHLYVVRVDDRERVLAELLADGIGAGVHYPTPVHLTAAYRHLGLGPGAFPVAERTATQVLSLPLHPHLTEAQQEQVVARLSRAVAGA